MSVDLKLEAEGGGTPKAPGVSPARYKFPLGHYVPIYQRSVRLLKGWIAAGRDAEPPEIPPLDEPARMLGWWRRHKHNRPPDVLLALAASAQPSPVARSPSLASPATPPAASVPAGPLFEPPVTPPTTRAPAPVAFQQALIGGATVGFSAFLNRLRLAEANAGQLYQSLLADALAAADADTKIRLQAAADQAYRAWTNITGEFRKAEADGPKILAASGKAWDADAVMASVEAIQLVQKAGMVNLVARVRPLLKACENETEEDALWRREVDKIFAQFNASQFAAVVGAKNAA